MLIVINVVNNLLRRYGHAKMVNFGGYKKMESY